MPIILPRGLRFRLQFPLQQAAPLCGTGFVGRNQLAIVSLQKKIPEETTETSPHHSTFEPGPVAGRSDAL